MSFESEVTALSRRPSPPVSLERIREPNGKGKVDLAFPLPFAAMQGDLEEVKSLLNQSGCNVDVENHDKERLFCAP
jgi:hypothetical protein